MVECPKESLKNNVTIPPNENVDEDMNVENIEMTEDEDANADEEQASNEVYAESEEFQDIDQQINILNTVLDTLEQKSDFIMTELTNLLNENRAFRKEINENNLRIDEQQNSGDN